LAGEGIAGGKVEMLNMALWHLRGGVLVKIVIVERQDVSQGAKLNTAWGV